MLNPCLNKGDFFGDVEPVHITSVATLPLFTKTTNVYGSFLTSMTLVRQAAQTEEFKEIIFEMAKDILRLIMRRELDKQNDNQF